MLISTCWFYLKLLWKLINWECNHQFEFVVQYNCNSKLIKLNWGQLFCFLWFILTSYWEKIRLKRHLRFCQADLHPFKNTPFLETFLTNGFYSYNKRKKKKKIQLNSVTRTVWSKDPVTTKEFPWAFLLQSTATTGDVWPPIIWIGSDVSICHFFFHHKLKKQIKFVERTEK